MDDDKVEVVLMQLGCREVSARQLSCELDWTLGAATFWLRVAKKEGLVVYHRSSCHSLDIRHRPSLWRRK